MGYNDQLRWRQIDAPQIDTRGLALAGQSIGNAFDRMGALLAARQDKIESDAQDAAQAQLLALPQDQLAAALQRDPTSWGKNVNAGKLLSFGTDLLAKRTNMASQEEDLANKQDATKFAPAYGEIMDLYNSGDKAGAQARIAQLQADGGGRNLQGVLEKGIGFLNQHLERADQNAHWNAEQGLRTAQFNLGKRAADQQYADTVDFKAGQKLGVQQFAPALATTDPKEMKAELYKMQSFLQLSPQAQAGVLSTLVPAQEAMATPTQRDQWANKDAHGGIVGANATLDRLIGERTQTFANPITDAAAQSKKLGPEVAWDDVIASAQKNNLTLFGSNAPAELSRIKNEVPGATNADIKAALDTLGLPQSIFDRSPYGRVAGSSTAKLKDYVQQIVDAKAKGMPEQQQNDIMGATGKYLAAKSNLEKLEALRLRQLHNDDTNGITQTDEAINKLRFQVREWDKAWQAEKDKPKK